MTQFRQVELIEQHVAGKREEVQQQLNSYLAQERELEDQSLSVLGEVGLRSLRPRFKEGSELLSCFLAHFDM
jgi:hypothetical protein